MINENDIKTYKHIHMRGIGGISMSGIAEILNNWEILVTGSDDTSSEFTDKLIKNGIQVTIGTDIEELSKSDLLVYTPAVPKDDLELVTAKNLNIPIIERADFLGLITKMYSNTIGVSGTHGKTTTTSMLALCFIEGLQDPTIQVGGFLKQIDGNYKIGNSDIFIIEACEYVESFLKFTLKSSIILNIDNDHLDYFGNLENIKKAFIKYVSLLPEDGLLVLNGDDVNCIDLKNFTKAKTITYGINNLNSDFIAKNITFNDQGFATFDVFYKNEFFENFELSVPGLHNVQNSLSCIALSHEYKISKDALKKALKDFSGTHRRFEYIGNLNEIAIFDDYGHHPTEIKATYEALKRMKYHESWVVFQPHTYNRTKALLDDFALSLKDFDHIIITDIYTARGGKETYVSSQDLVDKINTYGEKAIFISEFEDIKEHIKNHAVPKDLILTLGAGTIGTLGNILLN